MIGRIPRDYWSVAELIDTHSSAPPTPIVFLGAASALSCSPTKRSTEEETAIARAVSGSLCVCARKLRPLLIYGILYIYKGCDNLLTQFVKDGEYQKEIRGIRLNLQGNTDRVQHIPPLVPPTWRESHCFLG